MERIISQEERIRRAEEIYNRRKMSNSNGIRVSTNSVNIKKAKFSLIKKMALQLAICAVIYIIFYLIKNTNYFFSNDVINKTKELLSYDINFGNIYNQITSFIENNQKNHQAIIVNKETNIVEENIVKEQNNIAEENIQTNTQIGGIGGADVNEVAVQASADENTKKTQMEIDAEYVKSNYSLKVPLKGTITSRYGTREATDIISANHRGIDIGANKGTIIYAAMGGTVTLTLEEGDYRKTC